MNIKKLKERKYGIKLKSKIVFFFFKRKENEQCFLTVLYQTLTDCTSRKTHPNFTVNDGSYIPHRSSPYHLLQ